MPCSLHCTGSNSHGQLASSTTDDFHSFTQLDIPIPHSPSSRPLDLACGANHTLILSHDGRTGRQRLYGAGSNARGQLNPSSPADHLRLSFQILDLFPAGDHAEDGYEPTAVAACWETSFVVFRSTASLEKDDLLLSFGANDWGELANGIVGGSSTSGVTNVRLDHLKEREEEVVRVEKIRAGPRHVLALLSFHLPSPPPDSPSTSTSSPSAPSPLRYLLVGWGASRHGQLGPSFSSSAPAKTTPLSTAVSLPSPYQPSHILDLAVGKEHSAVLLAGTAPGKGRRLWLFGSRRHGQLGPFPPENPSVVEEDLAAGKRKGTVVFPTGNLLSASSLLASLPPSSLPASPSAYDLSAVGCTWNGTYVVLSPLPSPSLSSSSPRPDILLSFGSNTHGQLGCGRPSPPPASRVLSSSPSIPLASASAGQPHLVPLPFSLSSSVPSRVDRLACGSEHVLVHLRRHTVGEEGEEEEGEVWGWGWNEHGNLALSAAGGEGEGRGGEPEDVWEPKRVWPSPSPRAQAGVGGNAGKKEGKVRGVWAGMATSWVLVEEGEEGE